MHFVDQNHDATYLANQGGYYLGFNHYHSNFQSQPQWNEPYGPPGFVPQQQTHIPTTDSIHDMLLQLLQNQATSALYMENLFDEATSRMNASYTDLDAQISNLNATVNQLEEEDVILSGHGSLQGKSDEYQKEYCNTISYIDEEEYELVLKEFEEFINGPDDDVVSSQNNPSTINEVIERQSGEEIFTKINHVDNKDILWKPADEVLMVKERCAEEKEKTKEPPREYIASIDELMTLAKQKNPGKFSIMCKLGNEEVQEAMCDSGSTVSVMALDMVKRLGVKSMDWHPTKITFGDGSSKKPLGLIKDYPVKVGNCLVPTDFVVMDIDKSQNLPMLLGTPFLSTVGAVIDFAKEEVILKNVNHLVSYKITPPFAKFCGMMEAEEDTSEQEERVCRKQREEADMKRRLEAQALRNKQLAKSLKDKPPEKTKVASVLGARMEKTEPRIKHKSEEVLDGESLMTLFGYEEKETNIKKKPPKGKGKKKSPLMSSPKNPKEESNTGRAEQRTTLSLHPMELKEGSIEYKVRSKGGSKPFSKARAILPPDLEKDEARVQKMLFTIFTMDMPQGAHSAMSPATHFTLKPA